MTNKIRVYRFENYSIDLAICLSCYPIYNSFFDY